MRDIHSVKCVQTFDFCTINLTPERCAESVKALFIVVISLITGGCEMSGGRKICRQDDRGCYCWAAGQYSTLVEILFGVRLSSRSRSDSRQLTAACCKSITCGILQPTRVTVSQPGLRPSWNHQLWDLSHLIDHFYRSPKACLAITEYSVFYSYVQIQISLCIWYVEQISNLS